MGAGTGNHLTFEAMHVESKGPSTFDKVSLLIRPIILQCLFVNKPGYGTQHTVLKGHVPKTCNRPISLELANHCGNTHLNS